MFDFMFRLCFGCCFGLSVSYCFMNVLWGSKMLQDRRLGFMRGTRIMYKKEHFVFDLFSTQSILYLHKPLHIHRFICLQVNDITNPRYPYPTR
jgi:hypothetical protein